MFPQQSSRIACRISRSFLSSIIVAMFVFVFCTDRIANGIDEMVFAEKEAIVTRILYQMYDSMGENDFDRAALEANQLLDHPISTEIVRDSGTDWLFDVAHEVLDLCMQPASTRNDISTIFDDFRNAGLTNVNNGATLRSRIQFAERGELNLHKYAAICPENYSHLAMTVAQFSRKMIHSREAKRITDRVLSHAASHWGESSVKYSFALSFAFHVNHVDELPNPGETAQLRCTTEHISTAFGPLRRTYFGLNELLVLCDLRDRKYEDARVTAALTIKDTHSMPYVLAGDRWSLEMLEVQALIALGRPDEAIERFESFQGNFVQNGIGFLRLHEQAFTTLIEAYRSKGKLDKIPGVMWSQRKSCSQIDLSRMNQTLKGDWQANTEFEREHKQAIIRVYSTRDKIFDAISGGDIQWAHDAFPDLLEQERQHPTFDDWHIDSEWIADDIQYRLSREHSITDTERAAIAMSWRVLRSDVEICSKLISQQSVFTQAIETSEQQNSASAFYLHWALSFAFRATGNFNDAKHELTIAYQILKFNNRERSHLGLLVSRDLLFLAAIHRDATFDPSSILLPYELKHPWHPWQAPYAATCYSALASYCYFREDFEQAWQMAHCAGEILRQGEMNFVSTREWRFVSIATHSNSRIALQRESPEEILGYLDHVRQQYEQGGNPKYPELAWYFYEMSAKVADRCGLSKKAAELRISSKLAITPLDE